MKCKCLVASEIAQQHEQAPSGGSSADQQDCPGHESPQPCVSHASPVAPSMSPEPRYRPISGILTSEYLDAQRALQDFLAQTCLRQVMTTYCSVGFEFEFTGHSDKKLPAHVVLLESKALSRLFDLTFILESDSGQVIEIVMPPLLIPRREDGGLDVAELKCVYERLKSHVVDITGESLGNEPDVLARHFERRGLGQGWMVKRDGFVVEKSHAKKLQSGPYSQMNISMGGEESQQLILKARQKFGSSGTAEESAIGQIYCQLERESSDLAGIVHVNKALANLFAIPSILLAQRGGKADDENELSSIVKELTGVWVKDSLVNILNTFSPAPPWSELGAYIDLQYAKVANQLRALAAKESSESHHEKVRDKWVELHNRFTSQNGWLYEADIALVLSAKTDLSSTDAERLQRLAEALRLLMKDDDYLQGQDAESLKVIVEGDTFRALGLSVAEADAEGLYKRVSDELGLLFVSVLESLNDKTDFGTAAMEAREMAQLVRKGESVVVDRPAFKDEVFGNGQGVRKDTFIQHFKSVCPTRQGKPEFQYNIVELRSAAAISVLLEA